MEGMKQQAQRALDELQDFALATDADDPAYSNGDRIIECTKTIRSALQAVIDGPDAVDIEALRRKDQNFTHDRFTLGWNSCLNDLASRNLIRTKGEGECK